MASFIRKHKSQRNGKRILFKIKDLEKVVVQEILLNKRGIKAKMIQKAKEAYIGRMKKNKGCLGAKKCRSKYYDRLAIDSKYKGEMESIVRAIAMLKSSKATDLENYKDFLGQTLATQKTRRMDASGQKSF